MHTVLISDVTMKTLAAGEGRPLSFREKLELAKLLDRLGVPVIEAEGIEKPKADALRIKSIASAVKESELAVPVTLDEENIAAVWAALGEAVSPRLQVPAAVSPVQMEYIYHKKPAAMLDAVAAAVSACRARTENVEFIAEDATRADPAFLVRALETAIGAGAATVTLSDTAGQMLPEEFAAFIERDVVFLKPRRRDLDDDQVPVFAQHGFHASALGFVNKPAVLFEQGFKTGHSSSALMLRSVFRISSTSAAIVSRGAS